MPALELSDATLLSLWMSDMMDLQDAKRILTALNGNIQIRLFDWIGIVWKGFLEEHWEEWR